MDTRYNDKHDGVMHHLETLKNLNVDLPIELTEQVQDLLQENRYFDAHLQLHNFYASHYSVNLSGKQFTSDKHSYSSNQAAHANFLAQNMPYPNTESEMGSLGTSSRTIKEAITTSNELVLTDTTYGNPTTPQDPNDLVRCFYYIELVYGYDAALKSAVLEHAATRLADSPAWRCIFANWDLLNQCFITRDKDSLSRTYMLLKIISRSHQQYLPKTSSKSNISNNLDEFAALLTRIVINPEKYGFDAVDVLQRIDNLLQYKLVNKANMRELRKKLVELVTNQKELVQGLLESELGCGTDKSRLTQAQERLNNLYMISLDNPHVERNHLFPRVANAGVIKINRYSKEVGQEESWLGGRGRDVIFKFPEPCPIESFIVVSTDWNLYDGKTRGRIRNLVFRKDKEVLSEQLYLSFDGTISRVKEFIDVIVKDLTQTASQEFIKDLNLYMGTEIPKEYKNETPLPPQQAAFARQFATNNARSIVMNGADFPSDFTVGDLYKALTGRSPK